jgi:hypothetical protein
MANADRVLSLRVHRAEKTGALSRAKLVERLSCSTPTSSLAVDALEAQIADIDAELAELASKAVA